MRLMQSGKMKGQAFVSLPDNNAASVARKETNGFLLHGKPMVVVREGNISICSPQFNCNVDVKLFFLQHFARSTKPKLQV